MDGAVDERGCRENERILGRGCEAVSVVRSTKTPRAVLNHPESVGRRSWRLLEAKPVSGRV